MALSPAAAARAAAAGVVAEVLYGRRSLDDALARALPAAARRDTALIQEMAYGTVRWAEQLNGVLSWYLKKPLRDRDRDVRALLLVGLYQLRHMRTARHAAVTETVSAAAALGKDWARDLVNAVLRRLLREQAAVAARIDRDPVLALSHPAWLLDALRSAWPDDWRRIAEANNQRPPMTLRINRQKIGRPAYLEKLAAAGHAAHALDAVDSGVTLAEPVAVTALPGFEAGEVSVQDGAAQLAAVLLDARAGERVLDACAAPGGKACHILERAPGVQLIALDRDATRLARVSDNLERLGLGARAVTGDAGDPAGWWDGVRFDRILLDAPCSATGVIRRHPDIKTHRTPADIRDLARTQARLLAGLWPLLATGGKLLYVTCSILPQENHHQLTAFLTAHADARAVAVSVPRGRALAVGAQILPGDDDMDGFYYAMLEKPAPTP